MEREREGDRERWPWDRSGAEEVSGSVTLSDGSLPQTLPATLKTSVTCLRKRL